MTPDGRGDGLGLGLPVAPAAAPSNINFWDKLSSVRRRKSSRGFGGVSAADWTLLPFEQLPPPTAAPVVAVVVCVGVLLTLACCAVISNPIGVFTSSPGNVILGVLVTGAIEGPLRLLLLKPFNPPAFEGNVGEAGPVDESAFA